MLMVLACTPSTKSSSDSLVDQPKWVTSLVDKKIKFKQALETHDSVTLKTVTEPMVCYLPVKKGQKKEALQKMQFKVDKAELGGNILQLAIKSKKKFDIFCIFAKGNLIKRSQVKTIKTSFIITK